MTKQALGVFAALALATPAALAQPHTLSPRDTAGTWTGLVTGTFSGQPYAETSVVKISADGTSAVATAPMSTVGPLAASCTLASFSDDGIGLVNCTFTSGAAAGVPFIVSYAYTDHGEQMQLWVEATDAQGNPILVASGTLRRP
jgi:hypothetical protein